MPFIPNAVRITCRRYFFHSHEISDVGLARQKAILEERHENVFPWALACFIAPQSGKQKDLHRVWMWNPSVLEAFNGPEELFPTSGVPSSLATVKKCRPRKSSLITCLFVPMPGMKSLPLSAKRKEKQCRLSGLLLYRIRCG